MPRYVFKNKAPDPRMLAVWDDSRVSLPAKGLLAVITNRYVTQVPLATLRNSGITKPQIIRLSKELIAAGYVKKVYREDVSLLVVRTRLSPNREHNPLQELNVAENGQLEFFPTLQKPVGRSDDPEYLFAKVAHLLGQILLKDHKVKAPEQKVRRWKQDIKKIHTLDGIPVERIVKTMEWYEQNVGGTYVPVAWSGPAFREKFLRIESAMFRQNKSGGSDNGYNGSNDETHTATSNIKVKVG